jgi:DNA-binding transcriptional regulator YbjK
MDPAVVGPRPSRREDVLDAAIAVFHERGYAATSIQDVAERVASSRAASYYYIESKEDLLWHPSNLERACVYFRDWRHLSGGRRKAVRRKRREYESFLIDLLEATKAEGRAAEEFDSRYVCCFTLSALNGLPSWYRERGGDPRRVHRRGLRRDGRRHGQRNRRDLLMSTNRLFVMAMPREGSQG